MKTAGAVIGSLLAVLVLMWIVTGNDFFIYKFFAPKQEAVRRQVFEQTKSYNQGMVQELENMRFQYVQAKPEQRAVLASIILHRAADFDVDRLPPELRSFISSLRRGEVSP